MTLCKSGAVMSRAASMAIVLLAFPADPAMAQRANRPDVKAGDRWQFVVYYTVPSTTPNRTWVITSVTPAGIEGTEDGEPLRLTPELNVLESPRHKDSSPKALAFPLEVGKRWNYVSDWVFKAKGARGRAAVDVVVTAYEKVSVPAGEFDAFRLEARERLSGTSPIDSQYAGETTRTFWYAPAARAIVRIVSHNPYLGPSTVELVAFDLRR
ncbi:hypothetical protein BURK1_03581 [Burkholderiales bacterium]|nr:hypothetical protein BURK1_03581 [Burkholderiales bacterium]